MVKPEIDAPLSDRELRKRRRERIAIIVLAVFFLVLTVAEVNLSRLSTRLPFVNSIFFFGLLNVNVVILVAIFWLVFRNIGKLFFERRSQILGARLKTKLVVAFLAFSLTPTLILFMISSLYINSSFDKWFSIKIQNTLQASVDIKNIYYRNTDETVAHFADHIANLLGKMLNSPPRDIPLYVAPFEPEKIGAFLENQRSLLALHAVEYYSDPFEQRILAKNPPSDRLPGDYPRLPMDLLDQAFKGEAISVIQPYQSGDLVRRITPVYSQNQLSGIIAVSSYVPVSLVNKVDAIASVFDDYKDTNPLKYPIKTAYFIILIMITLVIIFVAIWMGLFMAREMTGPVENLVRGVQEVGAGNLDVTIEKSGKDEIAVLVESFNKMTRDLRENQSQLTKASQDLEKRRLQLEAVLTNIGTGVLVVDKNGSITTLNRAAAQLLEIESAQAIGKNCREVFGTQAQPLIALVERAMNPGFQKEASSEVIQWNYNSGKAVKSLAGVATSLSEGDNLWGAVVVVDDMTYLIKAQREVAWREVARRIAHEIKNPLTPIKLSAQRLQRRFGNFQGQEADILRECTGTIIKHTDELKEMVNEFSNFARFPEAQPAPHNFNDVTREVVSLFSQAHVEIQFETRLDEKLPIFEFDRDQMKRVLINLIDNAVAVLNEKKDGREPRIRIQSEYNELLHLALISVEDNGPGMSEDVRSRVFEPYFSTKKEGTGLGLAIAKRIVNDHDGFIRVQSLPQKGTQFTIELPTQIKRNTKGYEYYGANYPGD